MHTPSILPDQLHSAHLFHAPSPTQAKAYERGNDHARAIETYLSLPADDPATHGALDQCWTRAAQLCLQHARHRAGDVVPAASERLMEIGRFDSAAELYESLGDVQGAFAACEYISFLIPPVQSAVCVSCRGGRFTNAHAHCCVKC